MHWLTSQLDRLQRLSGEYKEMRGMALNRQVDVATADASRRMFFEAVAETASQIGQRPGVSACFVSHEGLVCEEAGEARSFEALAALSQAVLEAAKASLAKPVVGGLKQMVIVGEDGKLALFTLGSLAVGIQCGNNVNLARVLSA